MVMEMDREQVRQYLLSKHCSMWGDFEIVKPDRMELAIDWFIKEVTAFEAFVDQLPVVWTYKGWSITWHEDKNRFTAFSQGYPYGLAHTTQDGVRGLIDQEISSRTT